MENPKEAPMSSERKGAIVTGVLFIVATVSSLVGTSILGSSLNAADYLAGVAANQTRIILSVIFQFVAAATSAGIAMSLYSVLRKHSEGAAIGAVGFRTIEGVFYLVAALGLLTLVSLSQEYVKAGAALASQFQITGTMIMAVRKWAGFVLGVIAFCIGASMYYYVFLRTKLVPRWLSGWGLIGVATLLAMVVLVLFGSEPSGTILVLAIPIAVQEMVLAVRLIVKGFDPIADKSPLH
jgi:hypothetical protein